MGARSLNLFIAQFNRCKKNKLQLRDMSMPFFSLLPSSKFQLLKSVWDGLFILEKNIEGLVCSI